MSNLKQQHLEAIEESKEWVLETFGSTWKPVDDKAATACEAITLEHMGKFAEWCNVRDYCYLLAEKVWEDVYGFSHPTTSELIDLYFESINK